MKSNILIFILFLFISCSETKKDYRLDYGKDLKIDFPKEMVLFKIDYESRGQDYEITSYYALSFEQAEEIINQIIVCDSVCNINCWRKSDSIYHISNIYYENGYYISAILISGNINTLIIHEVKI